MSAQENLTGGNLPTADSKRPPVSGQAQPDTIQDMTVGERSTLPPAATSEAVSFQPGNLVADRYEIESVLGRGGMGAVYAVNDTTAREPRALKIMAEALTRDQKAVERFLSESRVQTLRHPHIVRTIDIGRWAARDLLFITMEKIDARNLRDCLRGARETEYAFTVAQSLDICRQVCAALAYAHNSNVIHRDIKPENILIHQDEQSDIHIWLMDFGIARLEERTGVTGDQAVLGTFGYMAPEQRGNAREADGRCDIFSVGVLLYELLTGSPPDGLEMPSELRGEVTTEIDDIVRRAIARNPDRRFSDAATMQASIERVLKKVGGASTAVASNTDAIPVTELDFGQLVIDLEPRRPPQVSIPGVPDIPDVILEFEGRVESLEDTIEHLNDKTHPSLQKHLSALNQLHERLAELEQRVLTDQPKEIDAETSARLNDMIAGNPAIDPTELLTAATGCPIHRLFAYAESIRNLHELRTRVIDADNEFLRARDRELKRLRKQVRTVRAELTVALERDLKGLITTFVEEHRDHKLFPLEAWGQFDHNVLEKRRLPWKSTERTRRAFEAFAARESVLHPGHASAGAECSSSVDQSPDGPQLIPPLRKVCNTRVVGSREAVIIGTLLLVGATIGFGMFREQQQGHSEKDGNERNAAEKLENAESEDSTHSATIHLSEEEVSRITGSRKHEVIDNVTILIDGHKYYVVSPDDSREAITLPQILELAKTTTGDADGVRVRILRLATARLTAWTTLHDKLVASGLALDSIRMPSELHD